MGIFKKYIYMKLCFFYQNILTTYEIILHDRQGQPITHCNILS